MAYLTEARRAPWSVVIHVASEAGLDGRRAIVKQEEASVRGHGACLAESIPRRARAGES